MSRLNLLEGDEEDFAFLVLVFLEDNFALGVAQSLHHDLLGGLRGDASRDMGHALGDDDIAYLSVAVYLEGFGQGNFRLVVVNFVHFHHGLEDVNGYIA